VSARGEAGEQACKSCEGADRQTWNEHMSFLFSGNGQKSNVPPVCRASSVGLAGDDPVPPRQGLWNHSFPLWAPNKPCFSPVMAWKAGGTERCAGLWVLPAGRGDGWPKCSQACRALARAGPHSPAPAGKTGRRILHPASGLQAERRRLGELPCVYQK